MNLQLLLLNVSHSVSGFLFGQIQHEKQFEQILATQHIKKLSVVTMQYRCDNHYCEDKSYLEDSIHNTHKKRHQNSKKEFA